MKADPRKVAAFMFQYNYYPRGLEAGAAEAPRPSKIKPRAEQMKAATKTRQNESDVRKRVGPKPLDALVGRKPRTV